MIIAITSWALMLWLCLGIWAQGLSASKSQAKTGSFCLISEQLLKSRIKIHFLKVSFDRLLTLEQVEKRPCTSFYLLSVLHMKGGGALQQKSHLYCSAQTRTGNRALEKPPGVELIPCRRKPLRHTRSLRDPEQTQVWSKQVWLNTTFISQGSRWWGKLVVET